MDERLTNVELSSSGQTVCMRILTPSSHLLRCCSIDTENFVNQEQGGYDHVSEFIPIGKPDASTLAKLSTLQPSETSGDRELGPHDTRMPSNHELYVSTYYYHSY